MPNTPKGLTYPSNSSPVAVPADLQELATDVDGLIVPNTGGTYTGSVSFTQSPSIPTPTSGLHAVNKTYADAINADVTALETELGTNPSGTFSTVVSRLDSYTDGFNKVGNLLSESQAAVSSTGLFTLTGCTEGAAGVFTATGSGAMSAYTSTAAVSPGETVTAVSTLAPVGRAAVVLVEFLTAGGANVGGYPLGNSIPAGDTGTSSVTAVAPATAAAVRLFSVYTGSGSGGDAVTLTRAGLWRGAGGKWQLPGVPIPGQSPIAVNNAVHLSGTGSPESVISAAPGSTYLQTDSVTDVKGWIRWIKSTGTGNTGWIAGPEADTGWRDVSSLLTEDWTPSASAGMFKLRRLGPLVSLCGRLDRVTASDGRGDMSTLVQLPYAFAPQASYVAHSVAIGPSYIQGYLGNYSSWNVMHLHFPGASGTWLAGDLVTFDATWIATSSGGTWPTSLPGSAA